MIARRFYGIHPAASSPDPAKPGAAQRLRNYQLLRSAALPGFAPDKCELADHYLPRSAQWYGADPDEVYMGNPHLDDGSPETGYYCFAGPIVQAANATWLCRAAAAALVI